MAVPSGNNDKRNTSGGAFTATTEGGTILGNMTTGSVITKALALKDNAVEWAQGTLPRILADGLSANQKILSGGTFAYSVAGQYIIRTISTTISGVSSNAMLIPDNAGPHYPVARFQHDYGADVTSLMRANRFSRTGFFNNGNKISSRPLWLNAAGTAVATPTRLSNGMWSPNDDNNTGSPGGDGAANPSRAIPGELVIKADWVDLGFTGGNFHDYKAITGM